MKQLRRQVQEDHFQKVMDRRDTLIESTVSQGARPFEDQGVEYFHDTASFVCVPHLQ